MWTLVVQAIEAHNAAVQYREAAEAEAQRFFKDARASHASWVAAEREHARSTSIEIDEAIQTVSVSSAGSGALHSQVVNGSICIYMMVHSASSCTWALHLLGADVLRLRCQ